MAANQLAPGNNANLSSGSKFATYNTILSTRPGLAILNVNNDQLNQILKSNLTIESVVDSHDARSAFFNRCHIQRENQALFSVLDSTKPGENELDIPAQTKKLELLCNPADVSFWAEMNLNSVSGWASNWFHAHLIKLAMMLPALQEVRFHIYVDSPQQFDQITSPSAAELAAGMQFILHKVMLAKGDGRLGKLRVEFSMAFDMSEIREPLEITHQMASHVASNILLARLHNTRA